MGGREREGDPGFVCKGATGELVLFPQIFSEFNRVFTMFQHPDIVVKPLFSLLTFFSPCSISEGVFVVVVNKVYIFTNYELCL